MEPEFCDCFLFADMRHEFAPFFWQGVFSDSKENGPLQIVNGKVNKAGVSPAVFSDNQLLRILTPLQRRTYVSARLLAKFNLTLTMPAVRT